MQAIIRPTQIQEIVPLDPVVEKYHNASKYAAGGAIIPADTTVSWNKELSPILWRASFPEEIQKILVSYENPDSDITNSDLELVGGILSNEAAAQTFDIRQWTVHSNTDNAPTLFWMRKGYTKTSNTAAMGFHALLHR